MVIEMIENFLERVFGIVPEWKVKSQACDTFIANRMRLDGEEYRKRMRAAYPKMDPEAMDEHIRVELEHNFYMALNAYQATPRRK